MDYEDFLRTKEIKAQSVGFEPKGKNPKLFKWQSDIVRWALLKGRCAIFADCGLGKTPMQLQWAQEVFEHENKPVLILAPLAVAAQTQREGQKFGIDVYICRTQADVKHGVNVTNYEMIDHFDTSVFAGVVLDESSILKSYTGVMKRQITKSFSNTKFRLSCTATPAPNDLMELLNQAEFLGILKSNEALARWFCPDQTNSGHYRLKGHAEKDFWRWVSSWAVCIEKPSDIGYTNDGYNLPVLHEMTEIVKRSDLVDEMAEARRNINMNATGFHAEKRLTISARAEMCKVLSEQTGEQYLIWCYQNDEADELKRLIPEAVEIRGSDRPESKEKAALDFADGKTRVLISKPSIFGYGLNFQKCHNMIFCGLDYSFESYYQAVRRIYRFGQEHEVNVWRVIGVNEKTILDTINRKSNIKTDMGMSMASAVKELQMEEVRGNGFTLNLEKQRTDFPNWVRSETA